MNLSHKINVQKDLLNQIDQSTEMPSKKVNKVEKNVLQILKKKIGIKAM